MRLGGDSCEFWCKVQRFAEIPGLASEASFSPDFYTGWCVVETANISPNGNHLSSSFGHAQMAGSSREQRTNGLIQLLPFRWGYLQKDFSILFILILIFTQLNRRCHKFLDLLFRLNASFATRRSRSGLSRFIALNAKLVLLMISLGDEVPDKFEATFELFNSVSVFPFPSPYPSLVEAV
nr:hypothetical protein Iba_chr12bCG6690 [Ipomoea batatas]